LFYVNLSGQRKQSFQQSGDKLAMRFIIAGKNRGQIFGIFFHRHKGWNKSVFILLEIAILAASGVKGAAIPRQDIPLEFSASITDGFDAGAINRFNAFAVHGFNVAQNWPDSFAERIALSNSPANPQIAKAEKESKKCGGGDGGKVWFYVIYVVVAYFVCVHAGLWGYRMGYKPPENKAKRRRP